MTQRANIVHNFHENQAWGNNQLICGVDEVGRGCLAGPVVTAAVILPPKTDYALLKDSKLMSKAELAQAAAWIKKNAFIGVGIVPHTTVDTVNIWHATLKGMQKAVINLMAIAPEQPAAILVDAMPLVLAHSAFTEIPVHHFPFGESRSASIAAASIVAKVYRDTLMGHFEAAIPGYAFEQHKGYATKLHHQALVAKQPSIIHRISFLKNFTLEHQGEHERQQTIC